MAGNCFASDIVRSGPHHHEVRDAIHPPAAFLLSPAQGTSSLHQLNKMNPLRLALLGAAAIATTTTSPLVSAGELGELFDGMAMTIELIELNATNTTKSGGIHIQSHFGDRCYFARDVDMPGNDISNEAIGGGNCCNNCLANDECRAYTFTDYNGGTCWYKQLPAPARFKLGALSVMALVTQNTAMYYRIGGCDMPGNDIGNELTSDIKVCAARCFLDGSCRSFTWSDYQGGTCWYKKQVRECVSTPGMSSGIMFK